MTKRALGAGVSALVYFAWAGVAHAATINVTDTQGGRVNNQLCGLLEAVDALNTQMPTLPANGNDCPAGNGSNDRIVIPAGTYPDWIMLDVMRSVEFAGAGVTSTIIRAGGPIGIYARTPGISVNVHDLSLVKRPDQSLDCRGLQLEDNTVTLHNVRIADFNNYAIIQNTAVGILDITNTLIENNGGGVSVEGSIYAFQTAFIGNVPGLNFGGGGLEFFGMYGSIDTCTFSNNHAMHFGGGIWAETPPGGRLNVFNTTIASNSADLAGGGIFENNAFSADPTYLNGVLLANNTAPDGPDPGTDPDGPDGYTGGNLIAEYTFVRDAREFIGLFANVQLNVNPMLGALVEVTTPVRAKFHPLLAGSPAIDFISGMFASVDQRGFLRPVDGNGTGGAQSDPGAFEYDPRWQSEKLLKAAQSSGDVHAVLSDGVYEQGQGTRFEANANSDFVVYAIPIARTGNHSLGVRIRKGNNRGIYTLSVSNSATGPWTAVGGQQDFYNAMLGATPVNVTFGTVNFGTTGTKYFRLQAVNKNAASSARWLYLDGIATSD